MNRSGLLPWLKKTYYPHYKFDKKWSKGAPTGNLRGRKAMRRGSSVDRCMQRLVKTGRPGRATPEARLLVNWLETNGYIPFEAQKHVTSASGRVFTMVDLVCISSQGKYVVFELKTGFRGYYEKHSDTPMKAPWAHLDDSVKNQHQLQLWYSVDMYERSNPTCDVDRSQCCVLVINDVVTPYPLSINPSNR